mmetsp:Transcript_10376/g.24356  ORF Transcript_10376/g.24356 Transcript_10376/m.24356 type:complete len:200 (+) Transcript_10376:2485-3084(+)
MPIVSRCAERMPSEKKWCVVTVNRSFICSGSHSRSRSTVSISQNCVPMASASLLLSVNVPFASFWPPPMIGADSSFFLSSWPPFLERDWDPSCIEDLPLSPSFSSPSVFAACADSPCTHSVPDSSILRRLEPNFWQVVLLLASSQSSLTTSPCFSASIVTLSMLEQASCHSSVQDLSISAVHSSPTALSRQVTTTWPRT